MYQIHLQQHILILKGVVSVSVGVDLNWDEAAFSNIANRALLYLGVSVDDNNATKT